MSDRHDQPAASALARLTDWAKSGTPMYPGINEDIPVALAEIRRLRLERDDFEQRLHAYKSGEMA